VDTGPVASGLAAGGLAAGGLAAPALAGPGGAASLGQVRVDLVTTPPGASVTIDGFRIPGRTPLTAIPVTGRDGRVIRAELEGYQPLEVVADLSVDARVEMVLTPVTAEPSVAAPLAGGAAPAVVAGATSARSTVVVTVSETSWLEVWRSTARNTGERLVFTTAQPGARYEVQPPVYVHVGNAGGVRITVDGRDLGPMGSPGAVLGRAYAP
jgi:cytoskeleton protein RodZ